MKFCVGKTVTIKYRLKMKEIEEFRHVDIHIERQTDMYRERETKRQTRNKETDKDRKRDRDLQTNIHD